MTDNYCLLKEEMDFAAEQTVQDFISHLRGKPDKVAATSGDVGIRENSDER